MGSGQRFRLSTILKRSKSSALGPDWPADGRERKIQHFLGINGTDLDPARNHSTSSSATARWPTTLAFSDATTELGSYHPPLQPLNVAEDLNLKASSVLLHEEFLFQGDVSSSVPSKRLEGQASTSTLNSFYDARRTPLAISQQTSESSRRDFALRKGAPVVVKDSVPQSKLFRLSRSGDKTGAKRLSKCSPASQESPNRTVFGLARSQTSPAPATGFGHRPSDDPFNPKKRSRFDSDRSIPRPSPERVGTSSSAPTTSFKNDPCGKMNIRRPKVGARYWFDNLDGDSSDDEGIREPECQPSFVTGLERLQDISDRSMDQRSPPRHMLPPSAIPPRISTLKAKSSRSSLSRKESTISSPQARTSSLASTDLHKTSMLDLSSSDDEESTEPTRRPINIQLPQLRDSIVIESSGESEIEILTAKAVRTKRNSSFQATPVVKKVNNDHSQRPVNVPSKPSVTRRDPRKIYYSDLSSNLTQEEDEFLTLFPPTLATEQAIPGGQAFQESTLSDTESIESRRMMSVTKQEESLLAAIRSKKAARGQSYSSSTDPRIQALMNMDRKPFKQNQQNPRIFAATDVASTSRARTKDRGRPRFGDANLDQASITTFQTGPSNEDSVRYSMTTFRTDVESDMASSRGTFPPLHPLDAVGNRMSQSTFFSSSTNSSREDSRSRKENHYLAALQKLQAKPRPDDEVNSQDFIDWPYNGWIKVATAH